MPRILFIFLSIFFISSCAVLDMPKRFAGFSIQKFEGEERGRHSEEFDLTKREAFDKTLAIIKTLKARVTHKSFRRGFIVAFDFAKSFDYCLDSTEAAFFIEQTSETGVKITVICNNSLLAQNLSEKFFALMKVPLAKEEDELL